MHYTQDLGNHPDKVFRNLDVRANDVTAIVTGEKINVKVGSSKLTKKI